MVMVLVMNIYTIGKEVLQISQQVLLCKSRELTCAQKSAQHKVQQSVVVMDEHPN